MKSIKSIARIWLLATSAMLATSYRTVAAEEPSPIETAAAPTKGLDELSFFVHDVWSRKGNGSGMSAGLDISNPSEAGKAWDFIKASPKMKAYIQESSRILNSDPIVLAKIRFLRDLAEQRFGRKLFLKGVVSIRRNSESNRLEELSFRIQIFTNEGGKPDKYRVSYEVGARVDDLQFTEAGPDNYNWIEGTAHLSRAIDNGIEAFERGIRKAQARKLARGKPTEPAQSSEPATGFDELFSR